VAQSGRNEIEVRGGWYGTPSSVFGRNSTIALGMILAGHV
jgi:hypothetical protein